MLAIRRSLCLQSAPPVERACRLLLQQGEALQAAVVAVERRPESTIHVISVTGGSEPRRFYLKTLHATTGTPWGSPRAVTTEYDILTRLRDCLRASEHLGVVRPIACFPEDRSLLTEEFPGRRLDALLGGKWRLSSRRHFDRSVRLCLLAGQWLRQFQALTARDRGSAFEISELFAYCNERFRILQEGAGGLEQDTVVLIRRRLRDLARSVSGNDLEQVGRHNDFRPENILTDGTRLIVLDFTGFTYGPRLYDFMKFWMKLEDLTAGLFVSRQARGALQTAFLRGYGADVDLRAPLARLLRAANVLDKLSEAVDPDLPRVPVTRRPVMRSWYRAQRCWLDRFARGEDIR